jgi:hypothetical protein
VTPTGLVRVHNTGGEAEPSVDSIMEKFNLLFSGKEALDHSTIREEAINWLNIADARIVHAQLAERISSSFIN